MKTKSRTGRVRRGTLAQARVSFSGRERRLLRLRLTPRGRRLLREAAQARITTTVSFRHAGRRLDRSRRAVTLRRR